MTAEGMQQASRNRRSPGTKLGDRRRRRIDAAQAAVVWAARMWRGAQPHPANHPRPQLLAVHLRGALPRCRRDLRLDGGRGQGDPRPRRRGRPRSLRRPDAVHRDLHDGRARWLVSLSGGFARARPRRVSSGAAGASVRRRSMPPATACARGPVVHQRDGEVPIQGPSSSASTAARRASAPPRWRSRSGAARVPPGRRCTPVATPRTAPWPVAAARSGIRVRSRTPSVRSSPERLAGWRDRYPDVEVQRELYIDGPRTHLLAWSQKAQLVVVGSRGRGGFRGLLLGSTSNELVQKAQCPVMVVRPERS